MFEAFPAVVKVELDRIKENQQWLAEKLNISHVSVSNWLKGKRRPSAESVEAVARAFGRSASWLFEQMEQIEFAAEPADPVEEPPEVGPHPFTGEDTRETDMTSVLNRNACVACQGTGRQPGGAT